MANFFIGTIIKIEETVEHSIKFKSRIFVVKDETNPYYANYIRAQVTQERTAFLDIFEEGAKVKCYFNLMGKEIVNKDTGELQYFTNIDVWQILPTEYP